jgi:tRNA 2-thiouridine synthesizing protein E
MGCYVLNGEELEYDEEKFLLEANFSDEIVPVIAEAEGIKLTDDHWLVVNFLRQKYKDEGHTPNFRNMLKELEEEHPETDWKKHLYTLFPNQPARQAARVAGLTKPYGKGGY